MPAMIAASRMLACCLGLTLALAVSMPAEACGAGDPDAWALAGEGEDAWASADAADSSEAAAAPAQASEGGEFGDRDDFDPFSELSDAEELPPLPEVDVHLLSEQHKRPVSEPPPGYQLHKLRRSGSAL